ncbi:uncharacterized protein [Procambarus clarkii]|uniref:uncharacterized protein n=1 Tax=Procambarus clarkii TaxID=6728 RepID=UPI0037420CD4
MRCMTSNGVAGQLQRFFSWLGMPREIQTDCRSVFQSKWFRQTVLNWGVTQIRSSPYQPQSQGAIERFHSTLKTNLRVFCAEHGAEWDEAVYLALFAIRKAVVESLGFSPFQLVYGHEVRSSLFMLREQWAPGVTVGTVSEYVQKFKERLALAKELAEKYLKEAQQKMSELYDKKATPREFQVRSQVMALLPGKSRVTESRLGGPYKVLRRLGPVSYEVSKPDRPRKTQVCHIDRLKPFFPAEGGAAVQDETMPRELQQKVVLCVQVNQKIPAEEEKWSRADGTHLSNAESLENIEVKLQHLEGRQRADLTDLLRENASLFTDVPRRHKSVTHEVEVRDARSIKQSAYRVSPEKRELMRKKVDYLLENELAKPSNSEWSSPCLLVKKSDGTYRFCTDYRKVNSITVADSHPMLRVSDCIDQVGIARYVSEVDLLKGYYQISLTPEARKISAFVTPDGLYQYKVLPFGMKNNGSCFQRMMNELLR